MKISLRLPLIVVCILTVCLGSNIRAATIVVPGTASSTEGNVGNAIPFGDNFSFSSSGTFRYQQVFDRTAFLPTLLGPSLITQIAFRPDSSNTTPYSLVFSNVQINLSITSQPVDALSTLFAANIGANNSLVYSGPLTLSTANTGPAGGPKDFDLVINFMNPFPYDPAVGNLLLDVRVFSPGTSELRFFDAHDAFGDAINRVFSTDVNSTTGTFETNNSVGLVTRFTTASVSPVPDTANSLFLATLSFACLVGLRRHWLRA